ncbi:hypothetical protein MMC30_003057 [Trapelia coarctata]|nr:hypothetical protein [Trapelia coarctata]
MSSFEQPAQLPRLTVLVLDGGGVRGLSSLLILKDLMSRINEVFHRLADGDRVHEDLEPHHVFKLVAGTSTGGLIAVMLGKVGLSVQDCITQYLELSETIFKHKSFRGRFTRGFAKERYSGDRLHRCIGDLLEKTKLHRDLPMACGENPDRIQCTVVCRELEHPSKYSDMIDKAVCICNFTCRMSFTCSVCDAARATSAAQTFFPVTKIGGRYFVDGGMQYNNPSVAIEHHYREKYRVQNIKPLTPTQSSEAHHNDLDLSRVRYVNIGTGTKPPGMQDRQRDRFASLLPSMIRTMLVLSHTLKQIAVETEKTAEMMRLLATSSHGDIEYERFSAGHGVCFVKLDRYKKLQKIRDYTLAYLQEQSTQDSLQKVATEIATEHFQFHHAGGVAAIADPVNTPLPHSVPQTPTSPEQLLSAQHDAGPARPTSFSHTTASGPSSNGHTGDIKPSAGPTPTDMRSRHSTPLTEPDEKRIE